MTNMTITLPDEQMQAVEALARRLGISPDVLVQATIASLVTTPHPTVEQATAYLLKKNADLYQRLA